MGCGRADFLELDLRKFRKVWLAKDKVVKVGLGKGLEVIGD